MLRPAAKGSVIRPRNSDHRLERRRLRPGGGFAGDLRQADRGERGEIERNAAGGVEEVGDHVGDCLLVGIESAAKVQREIQIDVVGVVAKAGLQVRREATSHDRVEGIGRAAGCGQNRVLFRHRAARNCHDRGAAKHRHASDLGQIAALARYLDHIARSRREREVACDVEGADRVTRCQRSAIYDGSTDGADAAEGAAGANERSAIDDAVDRQRTAQHIPILRTSPGHDPIGAVDLVESREAVVLIQGPYQAEIERVLAGAAELKRVGAGAQNEAVDDAARAEGQHVAAAAAEFDRGQSSQGIDGARIEDSAVHENADCPGADIDRSGVDDVITTCDTEGGNAVRSYPIR